MEQVVNKRFSESFHFVPEQMYFCAALDKLELVKKAYPIIESILLQLKIESEKNGAQELSIVSQLEELNNNYKILQNIILIHIFNILCLEAHINNLSRESMDSDVYKVFKKFTIENKWYLYSKMPKQGISLKKIDELNKLATGTNADGISFEEIDSLFGCHKTFNKGIEPFQIFKKVIGWRNNLVHFKGKSEFCENFIPSDEFFDSLGLTLNCAEKSCKATKEMILMLHDLCDISSPEWLEERKIAIFILKYLTN